MGWDETWAKHWKKGRIDRKAEVDDYFISFKYSDEEPNKMIKSITVKKSIMVGSTYYGAINIWTPDNGNKVYGVVVLTSVVSRSRIAVKIMEETMGPYYYDCPKSILSLLSPTENENALNWRMKCYEQLNAKKALEPIKKLKVGSIISFPAPFDTVSGYKKGETITLKKYAKAKWCVKGMSFGWRQSRIPSNFTIEFSA